MLEATVARLPDEGITAIESGIPHGDRCRVGERRIIPVENLLAPGLREAGMIHVKRRSP